MADTSAPPARRARDTRRLLAITAALGLAALLLTVIILVAQRNAVARALAQSWLRDHGVASVVEVQSVSLQGFQARLRLGDPASPSFTVERIDIGYGFDGFWNGRSLGLETRSVRLVRPTLRVRFDGRKLDYGDLRALIETLLKRPAAPGEAGPSVVVTDGTAIVVTPYGPVSVRGDGDFAKGVLTRFEGAVQPIRLAGPNFALAASGGPLRLTTTGSTSTVTANISVASIVQGSLQARDLTLSLSGRLPYPDRSYRSDRGPVNLALELAAAQVAASSLAARRLDLQLRYEGRLDWKGEDVRITGRLTGNGAGAGLAAAGVTGGATTLALDLPTAELARSASGISLAGAGVVRLAGKTYRSGSVTARGLTAQIELIDLKAGRGVGAAGGSFRASTVADHVTFGDLELASARLTASGSATGAALNAEGRLTATGAMSPAAARKAAAAIPDPALAAALSRALSGLTFEAPALRLSAKDGEIRLTQGAPAHLISRSGAKAALTARAGDPLFVGGKAGARGAFDLALAGGGLPTVTARVSDWTARGSAVLARVALTTAADTDAIKGLRLEASGLFSSSPGALSFALASCASITAERLTAGEAELTSPSVRLCPSARPLLVAGKGDWRAEANFERLAATAPKPALRLDGGAGRIQASGRAKLSSVAIELAAAKLTDLDSTPRVSPLVLNGRAGLAGDRWRGEIAAADGRGRPIGRAQVFHDARTGVGRADVLASALAFAKDGLQPGQISPRAAFLKDASGAVSFRGDFAWGPHALTSEGELATPGLSFTSAAGRVIGLAATVRFSSLAPLVTAGDQTLTIQRVEAIVPVANIEAAFALDREAITIASAKMDVARGRLTLEPTRAPLAAGASVRGAVVLDDIALGDLVAASSLAGKVTLDAVVDGRLPFDYGPKGLSILDGRALAVRPGRISISRAALTSVLAPGGSATPTAVAEPVNAVQDFAYQALENLAFSHLDVALNSRSDGRLSALFHINGQFDPPQKQEAILKLADAISGKAFQGHIPLPSGTEINLTLDSSLNFSEVFAALQNIWRNGGAGEHSR